MGQLKLCGKYQNRNCPKIGKCSLWHKNDFDEDLSIFILNLVENTIFLSKENFVLRHVTLWKIIFFRRVKYCPKIMKKNTIFSPFTFDSHGAKICFREQFSFSPWLAGILTWMPSPFLSPFFMPQDKKIMKVANVTHLFHEIRGPFRTYMVMWLAHLWLLSHDFIVKLSPNVH